MFVSNDSCVYIDIDDTLIIHTDKGSVVNVKLMEKIRDWKSKGRTIIVWTSNTGGIKYAKQMLAMCDIEVDAVLPKPYTIVDDDHLEYYSIIDPITLEFR